MQLFKKWLLFRKNLNFTAEGKSVMNANLDRIKSWNPPIYQPQPDDKDKVNFDGTPLTLVDTNESFEKMIADLRTVYEFAVDTESNNDHSYLGMIRIIQVSTFSNDYIIDPFPLFERVKTDFKVLLEDSSKIKIFLGCDNDILGFQRCFNIFPVGVVEIQFMYQQLDTEAQLKNLRVKFEDLAAKYFEKNDLMYLTKKEKEITTLADWRHRPLCEMPEQMILYARADTHLLIRLYDILKKKIKKCGVLAAIQNSNKLVQKLQYKFPKKISLDQEIGKQGKNVRPDQRSLLEVIVMWRNDYCKRVDENPQHYLPMPFLVDVVNRKPSSVSEIQEIYSRHINKNEHPLGKCVETIRKFVEQGVAHWSYLQSSVCNNCLQEAHMAFGCLSPCTKQNVKKYMELHPASKTVVNRSRRQGKAKNKRLREEANGEK